MPFAKGAALDDQLVLFKASLDGNARRASDVHQDEEIDEAALKALFRPAATPNTSLAKR